MSFLFFAISLILWFYLRQRCARIEEAAATRSELSALTRRVFELEHNATPPVQPEPQSSPEPEPPAVVLTPAPADFWQREERSAPITLAAPELEPAPTPVVPEPQTAIPGPSPVRSFLRNEEWEALVGGSLLNKAGAVVLVIGIALFLAHSLQYSGPFGRAAISLAASLALLGTGVWAERHARYVTFARGLIGAGWAALYATSYAIYALPAARIIENPYVGSLGMIAAALAMTAHSLRYRAQAATAVAFAAVFASIAVTPSSPFAVASLIPIAVSILFLAARFDWNWLPLFGLTATYLTCVSRGDSGAPLAQVQALFLAYWLIFELFDLRRVKLGRVAAGAEWMFPLNALGFLGLSYLAWFHHAPDRLWFASACGAALYLASSIARALLAPRNDDRDLFERFRLGSFEASLTLAAGLAAMAVLGRATAVWAPLVLAVEAEALYLAGVRFRSGFTRKLAIAAFALSLWNSIDGNLPFTHFSLFGYALRLSTPILVAHAGIFYLNRALRGSKWFGVAATVLIAVALFDAPEPYWGMALALFGFVLLEFGIARRLWEFRPQGYGLLAIGSLMSAVFVLAHATDSWTGLAITLAALYAVALRPRIDAIAAAASSWVVAALAAVLIWRIVPLDYLPLAWAGLAVVALELGALRLPEGLRRCLGPGMLMAVMAIVTVHGAPSKFPALAVSLSYFGVAAAAWIAAAQLTLAPPAGSAEWERTSLRDILSAVGLAFAFAATWLTIPDPPIAMVWMALVVAFFEAGRAARVWSATPLALCGLAAPYLRVLFWDAGYGATTGAFENRLISVPVIVVGLYWLWYRLPDGPAKRALFWAPLLPATTLVFQHGPIEHVALELALMAVALQVTGQRFGIGDAKRQALGLTGLAWLMASALAFEPHYLGISIATAACFFTLYFLAMRTQATRPALYYSILGALLVATLLYGRVSGGLLTVSWGLEGLGLLAAGFAVRDRVLRLEGLALFLICVLKLFLYDLRNLDTGYRILSFIALGLILLSVSWIYTRFKEQVARIL